MFRRCSLKWCHSTNRMNWSRTSVQLHQNRFCSSALPPEGWWEYNLITLWTRNLTSYSINIIHFSGPCSKWYIQISVIIQSERSLKTSWNVFYEFAYMRRRKDVSRQTKCVKLLQNEDDQWRILLRRYDAKIWLW